MSRALTSAQVIEKGDYLNPDFDPSSLTISQLLGVFGFHNINFPSPYTKGKLVQIFNDELKPKVSQFKKERLTRQNSQASDDGITDGITGRPINEARKTTRVTRRSSRIPSELAEPKPEPVKRRRSSAEPRLGGPSRKRSAKPTEPVLAEESEPEEPVRKVGRSKKKSEEAGAEARRITQEAFMDEGDSGWEDNNIFQSGVESSPTRASPTKAKTRRPSATLKSRKSMSVPPQWAPPSPPLEASPRVARTTRRSSVKPPESSFEPVLPPELTRPQTRHVKRATAQQDVVEVPDDDREETKAPVSADSAVDAPLNEVPTDVEEPLSDDANAEEPFVPEPTVSEDLPEPEELDALSEAISDGAEDENVNAVAQRIAEGGGEVVVRREEEDKSFSQLILRFVFVLIAFYGLNESWNYGRVSSSIGFCETGSQTNSILEAFRVRNALVAECNRENRTLLYPSIKADTTSSVPAPTPEQSPDQGDAESDVVLSPRCPPLPLIPLPRPDACEPCPAHAMCTPEAMICDNGFLLRPHPLLLPFDLPRNTSNPHTYTLPTFSWYAHGNVEGGAVHEAIATFLNGMPGFGPVAFSPRCVENPRRKRHIGALGKAIESMLAAERGRRVCDGVAWKEKPGTEAQEAQKWGMEIEALKETMRKKTPPHMQAAFEDTFNEAIQQLIVWGGVFVGEATDGRRYLAHHTPTMDLTCTLKVKARDTWYEWRPQFISILSVLAGIHTLRRRRCQNAIEGERVGELVQIALDMLRNQEIAHHTDPVTAPHPYLSSLQLRDLVLQDVHSVRERERLWRRVDAVVETNSNVRTNVEEVEGGDEMRVWRWVGGAGPNTTLPLSPGRTPGRPAFPFTPRKDAVTATEPIVQ